MKQGFYAIQFSNNEMKIDTISFGSFDPAMFNNTDKAVFLTESLAGFLIDNKDTKDPDHLASRLVNSIGGLNMFGDDDYGILMEMLAELISDYLK